MEEKATAIVTGGKRRRQARYPAASGARKPAPGPFPVSSPSRLFLTLNSAEGAKNHGRSVADHDD